MTQFYAHFDSTVTAPSPVIGWYDTGLYAYSLPATNDLLALTSAQWATRLSGLWAVSAGALVAYTPPAPTLTLAQQALTAMGNGLAITSTSTPALNGTYDVGATTQAHVVSEVTAILLNGAFADGTSTVVWADLSGTNHSFTLAQFRTFASAIGTYVAALYKCSEGTLTTLPAASGTIP